jgi:hypothetical protein
MDVPHSLQPGMINNIPFTDVFLTGLQLARNLTIPTGKRNIAVNWIIGKIAGISRLHAKMTIQVEKNS